MKRIILVVLVPLSVLAGSAAHGQGADPIKDRFDKARAQYDAEVVKLRQSVLDALQKREDAGRKDGDKTVVDQVKAERQAFEVKGDLPRSVTTLAYQNGLKQARAVLEVAYNQAIKEYLQAKMDAQADLVAKQLKEFQNEAPTVPQPMAPLVKGSVWEGTKVNLPKGETLPFVLKITDVNGRSFTGSITIDKQFTFAVAGQVIGDRMLFTTEKKGIAQQTFDGRMSKERMELLFVAISMGGDTKKGTVSLTLKNK